MWGVTVPSEGIQSVHQPVIWPEHWAPAALSLFCPVKPRCVSRTKQSFLSVMDQTLDVLHHSNIPSKPDRTLQFLLSLGLIFCPPSPTRFSRQLPQMRENGVPRDSLDEYYLTYSVLPDLSDSFWPYRSNAIFSPEDVDVSYARDVTSEYFLVIDLHLDAQVDSVFFVLLASGVLRFVIPVGSSVDVIWIRLCGRVLSTDIRWVWELCCLLHSGEAYGSGPKLDHGPTAGATHWLTCMCAGVRRWLYFSWFLCNVSTCPQCSHFHTQLSLELPCLSEVLTAVGICCFPGVTAVIPRVCLL